MYNWIILLYILNDHNIANQLYLKKKIFKREIYAFYFSLSPFYSSWRIFTSITKESKFQLMVSLSSSVIYCCTTTNDHKNIVAWDNYNFSISPNFVHQNLGKIWLSMYSISHGNDGGYIVVFS